MKKTICAVALLASSCGKEQVRDFPIQPVPFTQVAIGAGLWADRIEINRTVTIPYDFEKCEETGRISNFAKAGGLEEGEFEGIYYNDSDVFKVVEGASYSLSIHPDPKLESYLDDLIKKFAAAQEDDGYLYTNRTINPEKAADGGGEKRWTNLKDHHELYNVGHMYEAAVAHFQATGKRSLLNVAIKNADLIVREFGPGKNMGVPGHQEIEIGLIKLYRVTGDKKYFDLARFFIDQRGNAEGHKLHGEYAQDHIPVTEQAEAVGHAVRAGYMYSAIADLAALTGEQKYIDMIGRIWENISNKKLYITGGVGSNRKGEAFGGNYQLPNESAYNETCAAIAAMMFNHRLFLLHGESKYMDVFERTLYNGFLAGVSMEGNSFFYPNPLEFDGKVKFNQGMACRSPWFDCSCCPVNVVRFLPSLPGYVYAVRDNALFVNLFLPGTARMEVNGESIEVEQETRYPDDGRIAFKIKSAGEQQIALKIRIPGWAQGKPVPGDLYTYLDAGESDIKLTVNGAVAPLEIINGYAIIERNWQQSDKAVLELPMQVRKVIAHENVEADRLKMSLERGPLVYCAEEVDNKKGLKQLLLEKDAPFQAENNAGILDGLPTITGSARVFKPGNNNPKTWPQQAFTAVPYYAWSHRGIGEMQVWFPWDPAALQKQ